MKKQNLKRGKWTKRDLAELRRLYPRESTYTVAMWLGRPVENVKKKASRMGLRKSARYLRTLGRSR